MSYKKRGVHIEIDPRMMIGPRGLSISLVEFKETLANGNNVYNIFIENGQKVGEFIANKGDKGNKGDQGEPGRGIISVAKKRKIDLMTYYEVLYTDNTTSEFAVEDGQDAYELWIGKGNEGDIEDFFEAYRGYSISSVEFIENIPGTGNKYNIKIENNNTVGEIIAPEGPQGNDGNVNFATFEIIDGYLWATYTRDTEHMEFSINENGELEVTINEQN
ncbi:MAG: hypothetical protein ACRCYA_15270 [Cetobacterium sp.]|uniref:hypothetical protein n=1 Tax=Cetobacterium sp. TaxID=2071632 RepID=UPI003F3F9895